MATRYSVDLPEPYNRNGFCVHIDNFDSKEAAIAYLKTHFGANDEGLIDPLTPFEDEEEECEQCGGIEFPDETATELFKSNADHEAIEEGDNLRFCSEECWENWQQENKL